MGSNFPRNTRIIIGVSGGIAAYKSILLVRELQKLNVEVRVTMTYNAQKFIGRNTFRYLTQRDVPISLFEEKEHSRYATSHVKLYQWADLYIIAPCTANTLSKIACGVTDNMVTMLAVNSHKIPTIICPTMDGDMYHSSAITNNIRQLKEYGIHIIEPKEGYLASRLIGKGRLPEPEELVHHCQAILNKQSRRPNTNKKHPLANQNVLVTAGATQEFIDPVRYISNPSSGKMGLAMAEAAYHLGANVTTIHGPIIQTTIDKKLNPIPIVTTQELYDKVKAFSHFDIIIMAAAVVDFKLKQTHDSKIKKENKATYQLLLHKTIDILAWLGENKQPNQIIIGFAMETENLEKYAKKKLIQKKCDWILANNITNPNTSFGSDYNQIIVFGKNNTQKTFEGLKKEIAKDILSWIFSHNNKE